MLRCTLIFSVLFLSAVALLAQGGTVPMQRGSQRRNNQPRSCYVTLTLSAVSPSTNCQWEGAVVQLTLSGRLSVRISNLVITGGSVRGCCRVSSWQRRLAAGSRRRGRYWL